MINEKILRLKPKKFHCPICGNWHNWDGKSLLNSSSYDYDCNHWRISIWIEEDEYEGTKIRITSDQDDYSCDKIESIDTYALMDEIEYVEGEPQIAIPFAVSTEELVCDDECENCNMYNECKLVEANHCEEDDFKLNLRLVLQYNKRYFDKYCEETEVILKEEKDKTPEGVENKHKIKNKEELNDSKDIKNQLLEHTPRENIEIFKDWCAKHKDTFKWAIPVVCIYGAYKILNSTQTGLTTKNVEEECQKKLGVSFDCLKDNSALKELLTLGGIASIVVIASKAFSSIYKEEGTIDIDSISTQNIEEGLDKLEKSKSQLNWIQPKIEKLLPVAVSVIIVYLMASKTQVLDKTKEIFTDSFARKISTCVDLAKLFVADKFHIDLEDEEQNKKLKIFALLAGIVAITAILYGRQVLGKKAIINEENASNKNEMLDKFIQQVIGIMKKLMPTAFAGLTAFLVAKHVLKEE